MYKHLITLCLICCSIATAFTACSDYDETVETYPLTVSLEFPDGTTISKEGIRVELKSIGHEALFVDSTDIHGNVHFLVPSGIFEASSSTTRKQGANSMTILNGNSGQIIVSNKTALMATIHLQASNISQLVIKELYNGGVMGDDGKNFIYDKCIILYNNSPMTATLTNLCFGITSPYNSQADNKWYGTDGKLIYDSEGYLPAVDGIWYFPHTLQFAPYSQIVVNVHGAIDNTQTYPQSINYAHEDYYCMYDPESGYKNSMYYPTPSDVIPASHYLKAIRTGTSNAWALSVTSPALFLFQTYDISPRDFTTNVENVRYTPGSPQTDIFKVVKVPTNWVLDGIEVFSAANTTSNMKRLTPTIDAGYVYLDNQHGHTLYRNVDKGTTEALPENEGKLVYGYAADPCGIDAEASIKNGAHIVYMDTNNSSNDFHERQTCSLKD